MTRYTFVVQVHPGGISTIENLATRERVRISDLAAVGPQIGHWLDELQSADRLAASARDDRGAGRP